MHPDFEQSSKMFNDLFNAGVSSEKAANIIFKDIKENKFYILTDKTWLWKKAVKDRIKTILKIFE